MVHKSPKKKRKRHGKEKGTHLPGPPKSEVQEVYRKWYLLLAVLLVFSLACYLNGITNKFVFDDGPLIAENPTIQGIEKIPRLLGAGRRGFSYRPMRTVSYALDYTLNETLWRSAGGYKGRDKGLNPWGYHLSNYLYHIVTCILVFLVVYRLAVNYRVALLAAALFALHPVHTDSVTYLSGRRDILFTLFYLMGFYFFLCYRKTSKITYIIASFLAYLLSLGAKEMGVTLPALFLCYDLVQHFSLKTGQQVPTGVAGKGGMIILTYGRGLYLSLKKVILQYKYLYSFTFLGALAFCYYKIFVKSPSFRSTYYGESMLTTFLTVGKVLVHYMRLLVYPVTLNADYYYNAFPLSSSLFEPATFLSFMLLGLIGCGVLRLLVNHKMEAFGVIWFFVTLLPVCQIFPHHELLAEHYLYLPSVGFCLTAALLYDRFLKGGKYRYPIYAGFIAVLLLFSMRIVDRNRDWRDALTLWEKTVKTAPQCARAHNNLGLEYTDSGKADEAIAEYKTALTIMPDFAQAHNNLGLAYAKKGMFDEAVSSYKKAVAIKPSNAKGYDNLGNAYNKQGRLDEAITAYGKSLSLKPNLASAHTNLGVVLAKQGRFDEAIFQHRKALKISPNFEEAHINLGMVYHQKGELDGAISEYRQALALNPNLALIHNNLAAAYLSKKQYQLAITHCDRARALGLRVNSKLLRALQPYR